MEIAADPVFQRMPGVSACHQETPFCVAMDLDTISGTRSSSGDKPHLVWFARRLGVAFDQNTASVPIFQRTGAATHAAQPEMLNVMSVRRFLTDRMILVETKHSAPPIVKGRLAIRVCTDRKHETSMPLPVGSQRPLTNLARTWTSGCSEFLRPSDFSRSSRAIVVFSHCATAASSSSCVPVW